MLNFSMGVFFFQLVRENWQFAQGVLFGFLLLCFPWPDGTDAHKLHLLVFSTWLPKWTLHTLTSLVLLRNIEPGFAPDLLLSWIWILTKSAADSQFLLGFWDVLTSSLSGFSSCARWTGCPGAGQSEDALGPCSYISAAGTSVLRLILKGMAHVAWVSEQDSGGPMRRVSWKCRIFRRKKPQRNGHSPLSLEARMSEGTLATSGSLPLHRRKTHCLL